MEKGRGCIWRGKQKIRSTQPDCFSLSLSCLVGRILIVQDLGKGFSRCQDGVNLGAEAEGSRVGRPQHSCYILHNDLLPRPSSFR